MELKDSERQVLETFEAFYENMDDNTDNKTAYITAAILTLSEKVSHNGSTSKKATIIERAGGGKSRLRKGRKMSKIIKGLFNAITDWWTESKTKSTIGKIPFLYLGLMICSRHGKIDFEIVKAIFSEGQCVI